MHLPTPGKLFDDWSAQSQLKARSNAMGAATALAQRVSEAREVNGFLASLPQTPGTCAMGAARHA